MFFESWFVVDKISACQYMNPFQNMCLPRSIGSHDIGFFSEIQVPFRTPTKIFDVKWSKHRLLSLHYSRKYNLVRSFFLSTTRKEHIREMLCMTDYISTKRERRFSTSSDMNNIFGIYFSQSFKWIDNTRYIQRTSFESGEFCEMCDLVLCEWHFLL